MTRQNLILSAGLAVLLVANVAAGSWLSWALFAGIVLVVVVLVRRERAE